MSLKAKSCACLIKYTIVIYFLLLLPSVRIFLLLTIPILPVNNKITVTDARQVVNNSTSCLIHAKSIVS